VHYQLQCSLLVVLPTGLIRFAYFSPRTISYVRARPSRLNQHLTASFSCRPIHSGDTIRGWIFRLCPEDINPPSSAQRGTDFQPRHWAGCSSLLHKTPAIGTCATVARCGVRKGIPSSAVLLFPAFDGMGRKPGYLIGSVSHTIYPFDTETMLYSCLEQCWRLEDLSDMHGQRPVRSI
jgi:hypothetical protein